MFSSFEYNLSRPYPFKWFTPSVILGGFVIAVLVSLLNFVSSGYVLVTQYSTNPNATTADTRLTHWPSFLTSKFQSSCQSTDIPINSRLLTSNAALTYTLTSVSRNTTEPVPKLDSSLVYHNNHIPNCTLNYVSMQLETTERTAAQMAQTAWGLTAQVYITCNISTEETSFTQFELVSEYNYMPDTISILSGFYRFIGRDQKSATSLFWGESLLSWFWWETVHRLESTPDLDIAFKGTITFTPNASVVVDPTDPHFFNVDYRFIYTSASDANNASRYKVLWNPDITDDAGAAVSTPYWPEFLSSADALAKSMWFTVMADLGQTSVRPGILTDSKLLQSFTSNFTDLGNKCGPAKVPYSPADANNGPLSVSPSVLAATYFCQVPQKKPVGTLILAILIADLVILQALWTLLKLGTGTYLNSRDKTMNWCEGCQQLGSRVSSHVEEVEMTALHNGKSPGYEVVPLHP